MPRFEGSSETRDNPDAGFRAAAQDAVEKFKAQRGVSEHGTPVRLRVAEMYVTVRNPVHDYIVVLETEG
jgi:hypothetical protein